MALSKNEIEFYRNKGEIPDWYYYQAYSTNSPDQNLKEQRDKFLEYAIKKRGDNIKIDIDEKQLEQTIEQAVNDLIKGLNIS